MAYTSLSAALTLFSGDPIEEAVERLEGLLPVRTDSAVLADFLEDDLREGLAAIGEIETHFNEVITLLREGPVSPVRLTDAADDTRTLQRIEYLAVVVSQLRRRL